MNNNNDINYNNDKNNDNTNCGGAAFENSRGNIGYNDNYNCGDGTASENSRNNIGCNNNYNYGDSRGSSDCNNNYNHGAGNYNSSSLNNNLNSEHNTTGDDRSDTINDNTKQTSAGKCKKVKKPTGKAGKYAAVLSSCAVIGLACGVGGSFLGNSIISNGQTAYGSTIYEGERPSSILNINKIDTSKEMTPAEVYAANVNSTVGITTSVTTNFFGYQTSSAASGSGFIFTEDGYIMTNYHVVENASSIKATLYDGQSYDAELVGYDESNDIAVLKINASGLTPVTLGDSDNMNVGDEVMAIGNPLGELTFSLTNGVISALDRQVTLSSGVTMDLIQTDCAINSGNSGGALFNKYGEVIGITNAKYSSSGSSGEASIDNIAFAIPINSVTGIVQNIIEKGYISKPYIGISVGNVSSEALSYGLPEGAAVYSVSSDSPAEKAGLLENDIITAANGTAITSKNDLTNYVGNCNAGDTLTLTVYRQGETIEIKVTVGEYTKSALPETGSSSGSENGQSGNYPSENNPQGGQPSNGYGNYNGDENSEGSTGEGSTGGGSWVFPWAFGNN